MTAPETLAAAQAGDPARLVDVLRRQRVYLLTELRSLADARPAVRNIDQKCRVGYWTPVHKCPTVLS